MELRMAFLITVVGETVCAGRHDSHLVAILMAPRWPELRGLSEPLVQQLSSISVALLAAEDDGDEPHAVTPGRRDN